MIYWPVTTETIERVDEIKLACLWRELIKDRMTEYKLIVELHLNFLTYS